MHCPFSKIHIIGVNVNIQWAFSSIHTKISLKKILYKSNQWGYPKFILCLVRAWCLSESSLWKHLSQSPHLKSNFPSHAFRCLWMLLGWPNFCPQRGHSNIFGGLCLLMKMLSKPLVHFKSSCLLLTCLTELESAEDAAPKRLCGLKSEYDKGNLFFSLQLPWGNRYDGFPLPNTVNKTKGWFKFWMKPSSANA